MLLAPSAEAGLVMIDRAQIDRNVDAVAPQVVAVSKQIHQHTELRFEEHHAAGWLADSIEEHAGVTVERGVGDLPTAFRARLGSGSGPRIAILAEYDALPEIGHACGHNLIAGGALAAFLALAKQGKLLATSELSILEVALRSGWNSASQFHEAFRRNVGVTPARYRAASRG